jgi:protein-tyrosine phosphatase
LHRLAPPETDRFVRIVAPRTIIDLRSAEEVLRLGVGHFGKRVRHVHMPIALGADQRRFGSRHPSLLELHVRFADDSGSVIAEIVRALGSRSALPAVVFCAAGKDRTGIATALVLGALNVADADIVADYARTRPVDPAVLGHGYEKYFAGVPTAYREAAPATMRGFLASIRRKHGSVRAYLAHHGVGADELGALERALLTEE